MKSFNVTIREILEKEIAVKAETKEEAEKIINQMYLDSTIVLDSGDFNNYTEFKTKRISAKAYEKSKYKETDFKEEDLERGLSVVSPEHLAKVFNLPESEMQIDYSKHISPEQMDPIRPVTRS